MTHKLSILLVEDEKNICDFISTSLSAQDYRISTAHTGKEALPIILARLKQAGLVCRQIDEELTGNNRTGENK